MSKLPVLSGKELVIVLNKLGWDITRQKGSHIVMTKKGEYITLSIPNHDEISIGTMRTLIRSAGLTLDEFIKYL